MKKSVKLACLIGLSLLVVGAIILIKFEKKEYLEPINGTEILGLKENLKTENSGDVFGAANVTFRPAFFKTRLARSIAQASSDGGGNTVYVSSLSTADSHTLSINDIGDAFTIIINPNSSSGRELQRCTGIDTTNVAFTGCSRGYNFYNSSTSSARMVAHGSGETIIISNDDHYLTEQYLTLDTPQTIGGLKTISSSTAELLDLGDGTATYDKCIHINNGDANEPKICFSEGSTNKWLIYNDGSTSYDIAAGGSGLSAGKNISVAASLISVLNTVYIPTIFASSTAVSSTLQVGGAVTSSNIYPWTNNNYDIGAYSMAWRDIYVSGTIYGNIATSTFYGSLATSTWYGNVATSTWYASIATTTLNGVTIGGTTRAAGNFTALDFNGIGTLGDGGDDIAINSNDWDISSAGVISSAQFSTSTWDNINIGITTAGNAIFSGATTTAFAVTGSGTSTVLTGVLQSNSANTSTLQKLWVNQFGPAGGSGTSTLTGNLQINGNVNWTGTELGASKCAIGTFTSSTMDIGTITSAHGLGQIPTDMEFTSTCEGSSCTTSALTFSQGIATTASDDRVCWSYTNGTAADGNCVNGAIAYWDVGTPSLQYDLSAVDATNLTFSVTNAGQAANLGMEIIYKVCR